MHHAESKHTVDWDAIKIADILLSLNSLFYLKKYKMFK